MARGSRSAAAYRHVDINCIPEEHREEILGDADAGGKDFGLVVVEIVHNGPAQSNIYGVYTQDEERWLEAQADFGFEEANTAVDLTSDAQAKAEAAAEEARLREEAELAAVEDAKKNKK